MIILRKVIPRLLLALTIAASGTAFASSAEATKIISQQEFLSLSSSDTAPLIIDVRTRPEFRQGHVPGAINIPHRQLPTRIDELNAHKHQPVVVYCERGTRAGIAETALREAGFTQLLHLQGDMQGWRAAGLQIEK